MIFYSDSRIIAVDEFADILKRSGLDARRPVNDSGRLKKMLHHANCIVTAWDGDVLVGIARALTDFAYCTYLSDLAVDKKYHRNGIGKMLIQKTHESAGLDTSLILISAPDAVSYYKALGLSEIEHGFVIKRSH